jgi:GTPase
VRIAVCGALGSGKSTLIGVLCFGQLDDGDGFVRVDCFKHPHELISGQTSCITQEIMGFDSKGTFQLN